MKVYISASWRHKHAVQMITMLLRDRGHEVFSFIDNNPQGDSLVTPFEQWVETQSAENVFNFTVVSISKSDAVLYIGSSGKDSAAELGIAFAHEIPIVGLWAKGEDFGVMRKIVDVWVEEYSWAIIQLEKLGKK